jgi:hypothetical protein
MRAAAFRMLLGPRFALPRAECAQMRKEASPAAIRIRSIDEQASERVVSVCD